MALTYTESTGVISGTFKELYDGGYIEKFSDFTDEGTMSFSTGSSGTQSKNLKIAKEKNDKGFYFY